VNLALIWWGELWAAARRTVSLGTYALGHARALWRKPVPGFAILAALALTASGCAHKSTVTLDQTPRLMARPDFTAAASAAPEWTRDALKTIAQLEYEVGAAAPFGVEEPATGKDAQ
jgi:hypothetical protein